MSGPSDFRSKTALEEYLQDLICGVSSAAEVGVLIETLMAVQRHHPVAGEANARAAEA